MVNCFIPALCLQVLFYRIRQQTVGKAKYQAQGEPGCTPGSDRDKVPLVSSVNGLFKVRFISLSFENHIADVLLMILLLMNRLFFENFNVKLQSL